MTDDRLKPQERHEDPAVSRHEAAAARMAGPDPVPTSDALRHGTDFGKSGDKVPFPDPAMAPLGTDDEAAGKPPTREERRLAAADQVSSKETAAAARDKPDHEGERWAGPVVIAAAVVIGVVIVGAAWFVL